MSILEPEVIVEYVPGEQGPTGGTLPASTDGTFAANSDSLMPTQKATKTYVDGKTTFTGFSAAAAVSDTDTLPVNQGAGNLKQTFTAIKTWITNWLASAALTWASKTLTTPTINGAAVSGTWSGANTRTGLTTTSLGTAVTRLDYLALQPTDIGVGKPGLFVTKETTASLWTIGLWDTASTAGTINMAAGTFSLNGSPLMTRAAAETLTGLKTISVGNATTLQSFLDISPTDYGTGKPKIFFNKNATATQWDIGLYDGVNNNGTLNIVASTFSWNGSPIMTRATPGTVTGLMSLSLSNAVTAGTYLQFLPTDYGAAKPGLFVIKSTTASIWNLDIWDGATNAGNVNFNSGSVPTHNGVALARVDGPVFTLPPRLPTYTVATVPSAATYVRGMIYVSDGTSNKRLAISDGTNWRFPDGAIVS